MKGVRPAGLAYIWKGAIVRVSKFDYLLSVINDVRVVGGVGDLYALGRRGA